MEDSNKKSKLLAALQAIRQDFEAEVMRAVDAHPESPYWMVAQEVGTSEAFVLRTAQKNSISRPAGPRPQKEAHKDEDGTNLVTTYTIKEEAIQSACEEQP